MGFAYKLYSRKVKMPEVHADAFLVFLKNLFPDHHDKVRFRIEPRFAVFLTRAEPSHGFIHIEPNEPTSWLEPS